MSIIEYTEEELDAMRQVRTTLIEDHGIEESRIGKVFLAVSVINSKLRVEEGTQKILKCLQMMDKLDCPDGADDTLFKPAAVKELASYAPVGADSRGAGIMWVKAGRKVPVEDQAIHVQAATMQYLAMHADSISLREGTTLVFDLSIAPSRPKVGNESTLQKLYQSFPQRPQAIYIAGTNFVTRAIANASIKVASLFSKQKVLDRIQFVTLDEVKKAIPNESLPGYMGGNAGGVQSMEQWVQTRLEQFPVPSL